MEAATAEMTVVDRFQLKAFVEAVMVVDEGVATTKDVDLGMMMGAGILPGPLARADEAGLDEMLERLELAEREWGDGFAPPLLLRRLVNQGRLGKKTGQGFFFYPQPDDGFEQKETVLLETRDELAILWLNRPPDQPDLAAGDPRPDGALGRDRVARRDPRGGDRLVELRGLLRRARTSRSSRR